METVLPENLGDLPIEELTELRDALYAEFDAALDSDAETATLSEIADAIDAVKAQITATETAAEEQAAERENVISRVKATDDAGDDDGDDGDDDDGDDGEGETEDADAAERELVTASTKPVTAAATPKPVNAAALVKRSKRPSAPPVESSPVVITASADVPGFSNAQTIDRLGVARAMHARAHGLGDSRGRFTPYGVATVHRPLPDHLVHQKGQDLGDLMKLAVEERLTASTNAATLVAAGGWCAPSEPLFDLFAVASRDGLLDLPTIGISRGGVLYPEYMGIDVTDGALWTWCEPTDVAALGSGLAITGAVADDVATINTATPHGLSVGSTVQISGTGVSGLDGVYVVATVTDEDTFTVATEGVENGAIAAGTMQPQKACLRVPCPEFIECRLCAEGLCVVHGNLTDRAYPELTAWFVDLVMTAHLHRMSNAKLGRIVASADPVTVTTLPSDAAGDLLGAIDLQVADYRSEHLLGLGTVLEAAFPLWVVEAIRATLAARNGVDLLSVSDAQIRSYFTDRNIRPQFLHGYDPLFSGSPATAFPATTTFLLWVSGGYVDATGGSIDLGVIRDSLLNKTNDFTAAWSEEFYCVLQRGPNAREVTVTTTVDGVTGGFYTPAAFVEAA